MKLPIMAYGEPVLKKRAEEIDKDYPELDAFIDDMFETMRPTGWVWRPRRWAVPCG